MPLFKQLLLDPTVVITTATTWQNEAHLAPGFLQDITTRYKGTRLGRQELEAELVEDADGALWRRDWLERSRVGTAPPLARVVVAIDPAVSSHATASETGIVVAGVTEDGHVYVLEDRSGQCTPDTWARRAIALYHESQADALVVEANQGGDLVTHTLRTVDAHVPIRLVHATHGKRVRAEPVAALYEQGRVHHVGALPELEDQLCLWEAAAGDASPDRLDALVWAITALVLGRRALRCLSSDEEPPEDQEARATEAAADLERRVRNGAGAWFPGD
ncbi:MAG: hypothetical protein O3A25_18670 [Acidobacteria bacterium]|nr:hypothetical protein [Acidobacteriota bacterium]